MRYAMGLKKTFMKTNKKGQITIIGAGLAGCFMAILLAKRGYKVEIYERFSQNEIASTASKKSFNLTFYGFAVEALQTADLWDAVKPFFLKLKGSSTQITKTSEPVFVRFDYDNMTYYTIQRSRLLEILIKKALQSPLITFHFNTALLSINRQKKTMLMQDTKSQKTRLISCDIVIGADGVNSEIRSLIQYGQETKHRQEYEKWTYKQIVLNKQVTEACHLRPNTQHTWTRKNASVIAFPNGDASFTAMLLLPQSPSKGFASLSTPKRIEAFVTKQFPNLLPALPLITQSLLTNPEGRLVTIHTSPWYYKDFMVLIGDAAHGCLPFYGIGTSVAFGDCLELVSLMDKFGNNWGEIFPRYQTARKRHTDAIARLAKESFVGFRRYKKADTTAISDRLETILHTMLPKIFHPPLFYLVANNPNNAADYVKHYDKQKALTKFIGIQLLIRTITGVIAIHELSIVLYKMIVLQIEEKRLAIQNMAPLFNLRRG